MDLIIGIALLAFVLLLIASMVFDMFASRRRHKRMERDDEFMRNFWQGLAEGFGSGSHLEYMVIEAEYAGDLEKKVAANAARGWKLAGGVSAADSSTGSGIHRKYVQAMYKEGKKDV